MFFEVDKLLGPNELAEKLAPHVFELGQLCIEFGKTDREVHVDTEGSPESDTDHTFMLAMIAGSVAAEYLPELDHRKVIEFALVHDFVEVITKDVATITISDEAYAEKQQREEEALAVIRQRFGTVFPWVHKTIESYERLDTPEARFVKIMDKVMPGILQINNRGMTLDYHRVDTLEAIDKSVAGTTRRIHDYSFDQPFALALREEFIATIKSELFDKEGKLIR